MKKVQETLYLTYDGLTDPLGQSQVIPYLTGLSEAGYAITVVSCEKPDRYIKDGPVIKSILEKQGINWVPVSYSNRIPVLSSFMTNRRMYRHALAVAKNKDISLVHCRSTLPAIAGLKLKKKFGLRLLFDMRGFWADERVEGGIWNMRNPFFRYIYKRIRKKERELLAQSDHIISLTEAGKQIMLKDQPPVTRPVSVIPCCADFGIFNPENINSHSTDELRKKLGIRENEFVIIYTGSIGTWYLLDEMMCYFGALLRERPESRFLIVTRENHSIVHAAGARNNIPTDSIILASSGRNDMPLYIALANAALYFIKPGFSKQASSPVKQGETLAMGIPVITNSGIGDSDSILSDLDCGWIVDDFTNASYEKTVTKMLSEKKDGTRIREAAFRLLSLESGVEKYKAVYRELTGQ